MTNPCLSSFASIPLIALSSDSNSSPFSWEKRDRCAGTPPYERSNSTVIFTQNHQERRLLVYGGHDPMGNSLNDLKIYDICRDCWSPAYLNRVITASQLHLAACEEICLHPPGRAYHSAILYNTQMVVYGGNPKEIDGQVYIFDIENMVWIKVTPNNPPAEVKMARSQHSANLWRNYMVIFGGISNTTPLGTLILFDLIKLKWSVLPCRNVHPTYGHAAFVRDNALFVLGGRVTGSSESLFGISLEDGGQIDVSQIFQPTLQLNRSLLTATFDPSTDRLYIFGGFVLKGNDSQSSCTSQLDIIDMKTKKHGIIYPDLCSPYPHARCGHGAAICDGRLVIFGGCDRLPLLDGNWIFCAFSNSVWVLHPPSQETDLSILRELALHIVAPSHK